MDQIVAIIPARMASSRFPGKPLAPLHGLPMIEHVFRRAKLCSQLDDVYLATCDNEIRDTAEAFGAKVIMTSAAHERATDRVAEAVEHFAADIVVMIQGDEPMITPEMIQTALDPFRSDPPRQGDIRGYVLQVSDGREWREVARGELPSTFAPQQIDFSNTVTPGILNSSCSLASESTRERHSQNWQ